MGTLYKFIIGFFLEKLWGLLSQGVSTLIAWLKNRKEEHAIEEKNDDQAAIVQALADEIKKLTEAGQPIPADLLKRFRDESIKLRDGFAN